MKAPERRLTLSLLVLSAMLALSAGAELLDPPFEISRGPHHAIWGRTSEHRLPDGRTVLRTNAYVVLGTGMHYLEEGQWRESRAFLEMFPDGFVARYGHTK